MQIIFQDPYASLNPRMSVGAIVGEPLGIHGIAKGKDAEDRVAGIAAARRPAAVPRQPLSARVLRRPAPAHRHRPRACRDPKFIVADEPVSALDVSIQAQVINLLQDLQEQLGLTYLFIAHDLSVVRHISNRVAVMYVGKIVELPTATTSTSGRCTRTRRRCSPRFPCPIRPSSRAASASSSPATSRRPSSPPSGCRFHTRCPIAYERCKIDVPAL